MASKALTGQDAKSTAAYAGEEIARYPPLFLTFVVWKCCAEAGTNLPRAGSEGSVRARAPISRGEGTWKSVKSIREQCSCQVLGMIARVFSETTLSEEHRHVVWSLLQYAASQ